MEKQLDRHRQRVQTFRELGDVLDKKWSRMAATTVAVDRTSLVIRSRISLLHEANVPFDNNHAERGIPHAVLIRKNSYSNHSRRGEEAQAVSMSVYRTLKQGGHHPIGIIIKAIESHLITAVLPPLQRAKELRKQVAKVVKQFASA